MNTLKDGLDELREHLDLATIMKLLESTARWVDRKTFTYLPVWYPEEARRDLMYKKNWSEPQYNTNRTTGERIHKRAGNGKANIALTKALGLKTTERPNWSCCHIWSVDDSSFQKSNSVVQDKRYYSCVGNMLLLPTPLKAFTDAMQEVKDMLRIAAANYYSWCPKEVSITNMKAFEESRDLIHYPKSWPLSDRSTAPNGVIAFNEVIRKSADHRKNEIQKLFNNSGEYFPKNEVHKVLEYWNVSIVT